MTQLPRPANNHGYKHIAEKGNSRDTRGDLAFAIDSSTHHEIKSHPPDSVIIKSRRTGFGLDVVKNYTESGRGEHGAEISVEIERARDFLNESRSIAQRNTPTDVGQEITDQLQRSKWEADLEQALEEFQSVIGRDSSDVKQIKERATELAIDFESAPLDAIPLQVLEAVPEFGQYVDSELQNQIRAQLKNFFEPVTYEDGFDNDEPLTWIELAEERDKYFNELESYFERVEDRDVSVEERKRHMLKVFYAYQADNLSIGS